MRPRTLLVIIMVSVTSCITPSVTTSSTSTSTPSPTLKSHPTQTPAQTEVYISTFEPTYWGTGGSRIEEQPSSHGQTYYYGLMAHAPSRIDYSLEGQYQTFKTFILSQDSCDTGDGVIFRILVDDEQVYTSPIIYATSAVENVVVDVSFARQLRLVVDVVGNSECDLAIWGDPYLERRDTITASNANEIKTVQIINQNGESAVSEDDNLNVAILDDSINKTELTYQWYRNDVLISTSNIPTLSNSEMKTFNGIPEEYTPKSSHDNHTIQGYKFKVVVSDENNKIIGVDKVKISGQSVDLEMRGVHFIAWETWDLEDGRLQNSMSDLILQINPNWITVDNRYFVDDWKVPVVYAKTGGGLKTIPDDWVIKEINLAHESGLKVVLYPEVWLATPDGNGTPDGRDNFVPNDLWFSSYKDYIVHYAEIAQETHVELFVVGVELETTIGYEKQWQDILAEVRKRYDGPITYSANACCGQEKDLTSIEWITGLDYIGFTANLHQFPNTNHYDYALSDLEALFQERKVKFKEIATHFGKPAIFLESGMFSINGMVSLGNPTIDVYNKENADFQEQADYYEAFLRVFGHDDDSSWNKGIFFLFWQSSNEFWYKEYDDWITTVSFMGKPAEKVLSSWYGAP